MLIDHDRPVDVERVDEVIKRLGYVQLDSINYVGQRAHHVTLFSRMHRYRADLLTDLIEQRRSLFEHWTHDASVVPIDWYPHWKVRFARFKRADRTKNWCLRCIGDEPERVLRRVRSKLRRNGPLLARDFAPDRKEAKGSGWWNWHPAKAALEYLWRTGDVTIAERRGFERVYDLTKRVYPEAVAEKATGSRAHLDWACREALDRIGVGTPAEIAAYFQAEPMRAVKQWCEREADRGRLRRVVVSGVDGSEKPGFGVDDLAERIRALPKPGSHVRLLCPFDPVIRDRARAKRLFDFDYRFEAFTPAAKRRYGYYVLPLLQGDRLIGRTDPRFDSKTETLEVQHIWWEPGRVSATTKRRAKKAIERFAEFVGARNVVTPA